MPGRKISILIFATLTLLPAISWGQAAGHGSQKNIRANVGNCNANIKQTGYVSRVYIGHDNNTAAYISFQFIVNGTETSEISVKGTLDGNAGQGMYAMLLTAVSTQQRYEILSCQDDQVLAAALLAD